VVGAEYRQGEVRYDANKKGKAKKVYAKKEVIVLGGTFNSPQPVQLSGIADRAHLEKVGIDVK
jgi:choline dehydrogenase